MQTDVKPAISAAKVRLKLDRLAKARGQDPTLVEIVYHLNKQLARVRSESLDADTLADALRAARRISRGPDRLKMGLSGAILQCLRTIDGESSQRVFREVHAIGFGSED